jgi:hypothetical protein
MVKAIIFKMGYFDAHVNFVYVLNLHSRSINFLSASKYHAFKKSCFNFELFSATGRITKIWSNALPPDAMVWVILLGITQRIEGMCLERFTRKTTNKVKIYIYFIVSLGVQDQLSQKADQKMDLKLKLYGMIFFRQLHL